MSTTITPEMINFAATKAAMEVHNLEGDQLLLLARLIAKHYQPDLNGFALSKAIDDDRDWNSAAPHLPQIDSMFVDAMDTVSLYVNDAWQEWVAETGWQPPLPIGTQIEEGVITGLCYMTPEYYEVKGPEHVDTEHHQSRHLIHITAAKEVTA